MLWFLLQGLLPEFPGPCLVAQPKEVHKIGADTNRDYYSKLVKKNQKKTQQSPWDQMDAFEDAKVPGSHSCEAAVNHLKGQGNPEEVPEYWKKAKCHAHLQEGQGGRYRDLQDVQPNLSPKENMEQILLESISSTSKKRR